MASLDDYHFMQSFKGKRIKLTTKGSTFTGVVQRISFDSKTLVLQDVAEVKSGCKLRGTKLFFGHDILNIEIPRVTEPAPLDHGPSLGHQSLAEFQPHLEDEEEQQVNYVVIEEFTERFGPAVLHIKGQKVIGIGSDGVGVVQHKRLCWLQIATKSKVFLFDILLLGSRAFKNGLSMILESRSILKVAHDCRRIASCLFSQFGVSLTNVFDTQVADVMHFYKETGGFLPDRMSTLQEVISLHLKMPSLRLSYLKIKAQLTRENTDVWYVRPCPAPLLKVMALSVIHLQPLRLALLDSLLSDYTALVTSYLSGSQDMSVHTEHISKRDLELPTELRELELIRQQRQEWAGNHYSLTEDGLLERYKVKPSTRVRSTQELADNRALGTGKLPEKENLTMSSSLPAFGRGFNISTPVESLSRNLSVEKTSPDPVVSSGLDPVSQPISVMAGVAPRAPFAASVISMGRGFLHMPVTNPPPAGLTSSSPKISVRKKSETGLTG